jgi:hypothetical protein
MYSSTAPAIPGPAHSAPNRLGLMRNSFRL